MRHASPLSDSFFFLGGVTSYVFYLQLFSSLNYMFKMFKTRVKRKKFERHKGRK